MDVPVQWLLKGPAYVQYRTRLDLLGQPESDDAVQSARQAMLKQIDIGALIMSLQDWPGQVLSSHKSASQSFHTLNFLADIGLTVQDNLMKPVVDKILTHSSAEGPFTLSMKVSSAHGGSGKEVDAWALCDAPNQVYALIRLGVKDDLRIQKAITYLVDLLKEFGWPCAVSAELGTFRGPGRRDDPCPYANLIMLKTLALLPEYREHSATNTGLQVILSLWKKRKDWHPYIFYMGTDFCKLKAPLIWYDILHVVDVLSQFPQVLKEPAYLEMLDVVRLKAIPDGLFIPESVYQPYKNWDFGQKKVPSEWLTFLIHRILKRSSI